mmetsp:Transcript_39333/g.98972  ORF Transcript_39333/g.98972 Transcript_39333/m.98972 type:complete len:969 (-) Transcript_39333:41-2947(-)
MATNKFWGGGSSSEEESDSSSSGDEAPAAATSAAPRRPMARWAEESSSDDEVETKRVVRSHTDKRYAQLLEKIKILKNHMKIGDFASLIQDYEQILKMLEKLKTVVEQDGGPPKEFVKSICGLESFVDEMHQKHLEAKQNKGEKLTENKQRAFNTLRAKVRKGNKDFQTEIAHYNEHPSEFESDAAEEDDKSDSESSDDGGAKASSSSSSADSSSDSDSSSSDSDSDSSSDSDSDSGSDSDSDSSSGDSTYSSGSRSGDDDDEDAARERKMIRWLITDEVAAKKKKKEEDRGQREEKEKKPKKPTAKDKSREVEPREASKKEKEPDEYTPEQLVKKVTEIAQSRGRRNFDKKAYIDKLHQLMQHASKQGPRAQLYIYSTLVSADFDNTGSVFAAMKIELWNEALEKVIKMLPLLVESYKDLKDSGYDDKAIQAMADPDNEDPTAHPRQQELFISFVEKLDDELYKALQFTVDVYGAEYQEILGNSSKFLVVLKRTLHFFEETHQVQPLAITSLRLIEQLYYKPDVLNSAVYEAIQHAQPEADKATWVFPSDSCAFMSKLCRYVFAAGQTRYQWRALLCQAYHLALHDHFQEARDLLHLTNLQEKALESDVHVQILYNRVLAQMGLCAFRLGKIQEAHNDLMAVCMHNKARELLAQGLSYAKFQERTPEQERAERLRQFPYHMHINLEVLDSAHHLSAMLLEVPNLAMQAIDPTNKRIISRVLRRALDQYDKQVFTGPPENAKEAVVSAAKALQKGDWQSACSAIEDLKLWEHIDVGHPENGAKVRDMIKEKVKTEGLRTYLFAYASIYDAFHLDQLVSMFDLPSKIVHSIVSKMMIKEEITAFWDESSKYLLMQHVEPTPLQRLALTLADRGAQAVENNERLVDHKTGGYGFKEQGREGKGGGRWDQGDGKGQRRFGKGGVPGFEDRKGKGKGRGKTSSGPPRSRGWENARAGAFSGGAQRGWGSRPN